MEPQLGSSAFLKRKGYLTVRVSPRWKEIHRRFYLKCPVHNDSLESGDNRWVYTSRSAEGAEDHVRLLLQIIIERYGKDVKEAYLNRSFPLRTGGDVSAIIERFVGHFQNSDVPDKYEMSLFTKSALKLGDSADSILPCDYILRGQLPGTDGPYSCGVHKDFGEALSPTAGVTVGFGNRRFKDRLFAGLSYQAGPRLNIMAEYDGGNVNAGAAYDINRGWEEGKGHPVFLVGLTDLDRVTLSLGLTYSGSPVGRE